MKKFSCNKVYGYYSIHYGKELLGYIEYYTPWKKWVWNQADDIIMSESCLNEVIKKIKEMED